jgi:hypothetical protein
LGKLGVRGRDVQDFELGDRIFRALGREGRRFRAFGREGHQVQAFGLGRRRLLYRLFSRYRLGAGFSVCGGLFVRPTQRSPLFELGL